MRKTYSKIELFLRSLLFSIYSVVTMILYSFICLFSLMLPLQYRHHLIRMYMRVYMWVFSRVCHVNYKIEGLENIPKDTVGVILCKHQSTWETFYLPLIFYDPAVIVKRELLWIPFFGWGLAVSDPIAINRRHKSQAMQEIISKGKKKLDQGRYILIFPEGTRVAPGVSGNYRLGGPRLAVATGYPVIPVAHNAGRVWPRRQFIKYPGTIHLVVGPPISTLNRSPEEVLELTKGWIEDTTRRIDSLIDKPIH